MATTKDFQKHYQWQQFDLKDQLGLGLDLTSSQVAAATINWYVPIITYWHLNFPKKELRKNIY